MAAYSTRMRPDFTSGKVDTPDVANVLLDFADRQARQEALGLDRAMQQAKLEEDRKRYETELGFKQRAEDRLLKEQAASDQYYKSLLSGPQSVGGALNTQSFMNEATKYDMTPEEIAFSNTNKITTADQARKLGNENLARKIEGQMGLSNLADKLYSEGVLEETRPQMLERSLASVVSQGLPVPKELAAQIDVARFEERKAREDKLKLNAEELASLEKDRVANLKYMISNMGSGGSGTATVLDESGNPVTVSTGKALQKEIAASNKSANAGIEELQTAINKLGLPNEKKLTAIAKANELVSALEDEGIPTAEAAGIVAKEMTTKENNRYLSYIGFSDVGPDANKEAIASYGKMLADRYKNLNNVATVDSTGVNHNAKFNAARELVASTGAATDSRIAKLNAERLALMMSPEERMRSKIDAAVAGLNPNAQTTGTTYKNPILGQTKMPPSLVEAEGISMKPYKNKGEDFVTVGVGYAFNKSRSEIENDFKAAGIPTSKIDGLMRMDGTELTPKETASLANVSYDRHGVQKLEKIGIDLKSMNPMLAEIGVVQAFRGDIVKNGSGHQGKLYDYLKNNDLEGMTKYVRSSGEVPKEVRQRLNTVVNRYGPKTEEQYKYDTSAGATGSKPGIKELFDKVGTNDDNNKVTGYDNTRLGSILSKADNTFQTPGEKSERARNVIKDSLEMYNSLPTKDKLAEYYRLKAEVDKEGFLGIKSGESSKSKLLNIIGKDIKDIESEFINKSGKTKVEPPRKENFSTQKEFDIAYNRYKSYYGEPQKGVTAYTSKDAEDLEKLKRQTMLDVQNDTLNDTLTLLSIGGPITKSGMPLVQSAYKKVMSKIPGNVTKAEKEAVDRMIREASELNARMVAKEQERLGIEAARKRHLDYLRSIQRQMIN